MNGPSSSPDDAAGKPYWEGVWKNYIPERYPGPIFEHHDLYTRYLPRGTNLSVVEIGAMPGNNLVYFAKEFGYRVTAIDYCADVSLIASTMELNGIHDFSVINADVFTLRDGRTYDVVFSSGFAEHFDDYEEVLAMHARFVNVGGYLLITVPNTRFLHKLLMQAFCPAVLAIHRPYLMDRDVMRRGVERLGFDVLFCDYLKTFRLTYGLPGWLNLIPRIVNKALRVLRLDNIGNRFASPYLYLVARKRADPEQSVSKPSQ